MRLTIDRDIQYVAQQALAAKVAEAHADSGTLVVMDPRTGQILALATAPTFDPNRASSSSAADRGNRALTNVFEPGSTAKLMTLAAVVNEGKANPYSTFTVPGGLSRGGKVFHDHNAHGTLHLTLAGIMAESSNIGTILASERIGGRKLYKYLKKFGIGEPTGLNFPGESTGYRAAPCRLVCHLLPDDRVRPGTEPQRGAVGERLRHDRQRGRAGRAEPRAGADPRRRHDGAAGRAEDHAGRERGDRQADAGDARERGDGRHGSDGCHPRLPGRWQDRHGAGLQRRCRCYSGVIASFIGMAPADDPALVVAVSIFNPRVGRFGGELGGPVFKRVMTYALQARQVPPTGTRAPNLALTFGG